MKIALLFPGQGAQKVGMGLDFYEAFPHVKAIYDQFPLIRDICFKNENDGLSHTLTTQQAILLTSVSMASLLKKHLSITAMAGLSLGEYSALVTSEACSLEEAMPLIQKRGHLMQEALKDHESGMSAIISNDLEQIKKIIEEANHLGVCSIANINAPNQVVMSGSREALDFAKTKLMDAGIRKVIPLRVAGAFHSAYLKEVSQPLTVALQEVSWETSTCPIVMNVDALPHTHSFIEPLRQQIYSSVLWMDSLKALEELGVDTMIEVGPSSSLSSMIQTTCPNIHHYVVNDVLSFEKTLKELL
jgi:[acyl-carrier-protein] S-malonyltransferase